MIMEWMVVTREGKRGEILLIYDPLMKSVVPTDVQEMLTAVGSINSADHYTFYCHLQALKR